MVKDHVNVEYKICDHVHTTCRIFVNVSQSHKFYIMYTWYHIHVDVYMIVSDTYHVYMIWQSWQKLGSRLTYTFFISCIILHDLTIRTWSWFQVHMNYIMYTWYHIHVHVNMIVSDTYHVHMIQNRNMNFFPGSHEFLFRVNKKLYHVLKIIMSHDESSC